MFYPYMVASDFRGALARIKTHKRSTRRAFLWLSPAAAAAAAAPRGSCPPVAPAPATATAVERGPVLLLLLGVKMQVVHRQRRTTVVAGLHRHHHHGGLLQVRLKLRVLRRAIHVKWRRPHHFVREWLHRRRLECLL